MSVLKPDSVIGCVGENDIYRNTSRIDVVYDGDKMTFNYWRPVIPSGDWKTWLIYKFNRPKKITKISFSFGGGGEDNSCRIAKNIDTNYNSETLRVPGTLFTINYKNLNDANININTVSILNFPRKNLDDVQLENYSTPINNVDNLLFVFQKPVNIIEIECIGEDLPIPYLKSEKSELTVKNLDNNTFFNINSSNKIYPKNSLSNDKFQITSQITDRIFIYDNTNKLVHITDYIPKGTTQKVTINYTNNGVLNVTSSVVPVIKSSYASVGNIPYSGCDNNNKNNCKVVLKGYEWNKEPFNPLKINNNSFCRALGSTFRGGQSMYLGNVIDNKCRVREYYDIDGRGNYMGDRLSDKSDFEYLNLLNDSGIIWTNKNNVPSDSKRRVLVQINSWDPNNEVANSICKVNDMIGQIEGDYCLLSNDPYNKRFTYNNFDVLYQAGKEP